MTTHHVHAYSASIAQRNLKNKYLIDDHLRAKCGAPLRVELVEESGACVSEGLPLGTQLEVSQVLYGLPCLGLDPSFGLGATAGFPPQL